MTVFHKIKWRNLLSTGNEWTEISLDTSPSTLIVGPNGAGKSTLLDALSFALFGKPHRSINKPNLVNSVNDKNCEVEVEFSIGPARFKIVRGLKPAKFEIYQNGTLINQESNVLDYQKVLEKNILKLNHKSFHQIVVLGSSSFIPFMQLTTQHRREVIDDLLDINIFTKMATLLKERVALNREAMTQNSYEIEVLKEKIRIQEKYLSDLRSLDEEHRTKSKEKLILLEAEAQKLTDENKVLQDKLQVDQEKSKDFLRALHDRKHTLHTYSTQIETNIRNVVRDARFYEENCECPTCAQAIDSSFKENKILFCKSKAKELSEGKDKLVIEMQKLEHELELASLRSDEISRLGSRIVSNNMAVSSLNKQIREIEKEISEAVGADMSSAKQTLSELSAQMNSLGAKKNTMLQEGSYNLAMGEMLKDTGIKTKVIRQYLPVMNKLINSYLGVLDFFVSFNLNENFEESIKSRHRDDFSYASFSEGEKQRIDLALLFTWRQVARMKNSVSTNLLILDETFDSSMDTDGVDNLLKILTTLEEGTNIFIISHKTDALDGKFAEKLEFEKRQNFSYIKQKSA
jgi:DNA repair exonuclease SbcCD ATPase subunit